jgi:soluble lytic murein transglycosylase-like protein
LAQHTTNEEISEIILYMAKRYNIDASLIYTLISIESNFKPLVITIETTPKIAEFLKALREIGLKVVTGGHTFHSKEAIVNIYPEDIAMAQYIAESLKQNGYAFDLGLMQIHSTNFLLEETALLVYPKNNLEKGLNILQECLKIFLEKKDQIECYNRGAGNLKKAHKKGIITYPYYKRYKAHYNRYFKEQ